MVYFKQHGPIIKCYVYIQNHPSMAEKEMSRAAPANAHRWDACLDTINKRTGYHCICTYLIEFNAGMFRSKMSLIFAIAESDSRNCGVVKLIA